MKTLLELIKNPQASIFAVAHWMLVLYLIFERQMRKPIPLFGGYPVTWQDDLFDLILIIDLPSIFPAMLLLSPKFKFDTEHIFTNAVIFISIFTVTLQWLIIGKIVFNIFSKFESQMTTLSLKDE